MKAWLKQILMTHYIGAIVIALLVVNAILDLIRAVTFPIPVLIQNRVHARTYSGFDSGQTAFLVSQTGATLISAVLLLLAAYLLACWLFGAPPEASPDDDVEDSQSDNAA